MKKIISINFIFLTFSLISYADFETGNSLLSKMSYEFTGETTPEAVDLLMAEGYITGVFDAYQGLFFEATEGITVGQIVEIAKKYLEGHPEIRHQPATDLLLKTFEEAFPLKKEIDKKERGK